MNFSQIYTFLCLLPALLMNVSIFTVLAEDPACFLINYDVVNLTRALYWELDWSEKGGCLEGVDSCKFYFSICKPLPVVFTGEGPRCPNSAVCLDTPPTQKGGNDTFYGIGNHLANPFTGESTTQFWARYPVGQPYRKPDNVTVCFTSTILHFVCDPSVPWIAISDPTKGSKVPNVMKVTYVPDTCRHVISMRFAGACSRDAQPVQSQSMSAGSVLLIMFVCALSVYCIGGMTYNHCHGAHGKEILPHIDFWEELPKNIKAGFTITRQFMTCQEIPTQSPTYEQL